MMKCWLLRNNGCHSIKGIAQAKENLAKGNLIPTKEGYKGAVRLKEKSVEEVAAEHDKRKITA